MTVHRKIVPFNWWKLVYEHSPAYDMKFLSFGEHPAPHQMSNALGLSLYVVLKVFQRFNK